MNVYEFGEELVVSGDLDPVYTYAVEQNMPHDQLKRWLVAYSMFYHVGVADYASKQTGLDYWKWILDNLDELPRGSERRHFRGGQAEAAIAEVERLEPEEIVEEWFQETTFKAVAQNVQKFRGYGTWISFKLADMGERVMGYPVDFTDCVLGIYSEPRKGAALVKFGDEEAHITNKEVMEVVDDILKELKGLKAPPSLDRLLNIQEAETILCKFKSYSNGHYFIGKDIEEVKKAAEWNPTLLNIRSS